MSNYKQTLILKRKLYQVYPSWQEPHIKILYIWFKSLLFIFFSAGHEPGCNCSVAKGTVNSYKAENVHCMLVPWWVGETRSLIIIDNNIQSRPACDQNVPGQALLLIR